MSAAGPTYPKYLRPEARPSHPDRLDAEQRQAFDQVVKHLLEAADRLQLREPASRYEARAEPANWLSRDRSSQLLFLSGGRGTGKTTVLMSLLDATRPRTEPAWSGSAAGTRAPAAEQSSGDARLNLLRQRLVW